MGIVSISLNEKNEKDIKMLQQEGGYSGRSEVIRAAIRSLMADAKQLSKLKGVTEGVLIVVNDEKEEEDISRIRHKHASVVKTQLHNHIAGHKCLQVFVMDGASEKIISLVKELESSGKVDYCKLIVP